MNNKFSIYIIGPFTPWKWRDEIISLINNLKSANKEIFSHIDKKIEILDPRKRFTDNKRLSDEELHNIVSGDIKNCMEADMILMYKPCNVTTLGTYMELSHIINRIDNYPDVILISDDNFVLNNPWIKYYFKNGLIINSYKNLDEEKILKEYILNTFIQKCT